MAIEYKNDENYIKGLEYQDFVLDILCERGIVLTNYVSKKYQFNKGENKFGMEIKFDDKYEYTGNLFIEIEEKEKEENLRYAKSGIYRNDNSWLYLIGNYEIIFIFGINDLRKLHASNDYEEKTIPTSRGFILPQLVAREWALKIIDNLQIRRIIN